MLTERRGPLRASVYYTVSNVAAEALWARHPRYRLLRYEDFVERPGETLLAIAELLDEKLAIDEVLEDRRFTVRSLHSAWGNPNRFEHGRIELADDQRWRSDLGRAECLQLAWLNWPLMRRYGYLASRRRARLAPSSRPADCRRAPEW